MLVTATARPAVPTRPPVGTKPHRARIMPCWVLGAGCWVLGKGRPGAGGAVSVFHRRICRRRAFARRHCGCDPSRLMRSALAPGMTWGGRSWMMRMISVYADACIRRDHRHRHRGAALAIPTDVLPAVTKLSTNGRLLARLGIEGYGCVRFAYIRHPLPGDDSRYGRACASRALELAAGRSQLTTHYCGWLLPRAIPRRYANHGCVGGRVATILPGRFETA